MSKRHKQRLGHHWQGVTAWESTQQPIPLHTAPPSQTLILIHYWTILLLPTPLLWVSDSTWLPRHQLQSCGLDFCTKGGDMEWFYFDPTGDFPQGRISSPNEGSHRAVLALLTVSYSRAQRPLAQRSSHLHNCRSGAFQAIVELPARFAPEGSGSQRRTELSEWLPGPGLVLQEAERLWGEQNLWETSTTDQKPSVKPLCHRTQQVQHV